LAEYKQYERRNIYAGKEMSTEKERTGAAASAAATEEL